MKGRWVAALAAAGAVLVAGGARAAVDARPTGKLELPSPVLDTASADGRRLFVLLEGGEVQIFDGGRNLQGTLAVGKDAERIAVSADGESLYVTSRAAKEVAVWSVQLLQSIDVSGSPFQGPADAPVVLAVYSDFQ